MGNLHKKHLKIPKSLNDRISHSIKEHELLNVLPELCVPYSVRKVNGGKLTYFNFSLAKEMGLIPENLEEKISSELEEAVLENFNLRIINEYDRIHHTQFKSEDIKSFKCFSTRYLQLQHKNKQGRTSGDGRAIWNGQVSHKGKTWDLNSRGTGVTCMAPGLVEVEMPLETGNEDYGYSCGLSEMPEIYASAIMSERFHQHGFSTERILAAIDNGQGLGICIRAHENLLRPAHIFRYLKLGDHYGAKKLLDYCIDRDYKNKRIKFNSQYKNAYEKYLEVFSESFLNLCADAFHREIFLWLDWDGDNILIDGGIIDYGSVRRFGSHHNRYKYDDTSRYSTNLDEQIKKGKLTVQVFAQLTHFVKTGEKRPLEDFLDEEHVKSFENTFDQKLKENFLKDIGVNGAELKKLLRWHKEQTDKIYRSYVKLKQKKTTKEQKTLDGINQWPALNMNAFLMDLAKSLSSHNKLQTDKYLACFAEFEPKHENLEEVSMLLNAFSDDLKDFSQENNLSLEYRGDFGIRLTTSAVLDLIGQIMELSQNKIQSAVLDCVNFGFKGASRWVSKAKELYRDDL